MATLIRFILAFVVVQLISVRPTHAISVYTFESLTTPGDLPPQDNWSDASSGGAFIDVTAGAGSNTSTVAVSPGGGLSIHQARRQNDGAFSIPNFTGTETNAYLQADFRVINGVNFNFYVTGLGGISPWIGIIDDVPAVPAIVTPHFALRGASHGTSDYAPIPAGYDQGDWLRIRLEMDLTANGGNGFGDVSFQNLTQGDTGFTSVAALQDRNLNMGAVDASQWNTMGIRTDVDATASQIDNLTTAVPEPSTLVLAALGLLSLGMTRRRRHR